MDANLITAERIRGELVECFKLLNSLGSVSGMNDKKEVLRKGIANTVLKVLLKLTYDPFIQFYIKKLPKTSSAVTSDYYVNYAEFLILVNDLKNRKITGDLAKAGLKKFLEGCTELEQSWYGKVIQRDLKCGVNTTTINKVFPNLVPEYKVMLAEAIPLEDIGLDTENALKLLPDEYYNEPKLDGTRLNLFVDDDVMMLSRNGKMLWGYDNLAAEALKKLPKGFVYDGELMSPNFQVSDGTKPTADTFNEAMSVVFSKKITNKQGIFNIFDAVPIEEWSSRKTSQKLEDRKKFLQEINKTYDTMKIVNWTRKYDKNNKKDILDTVTCLNTYTHQGYEGSMIKNVNAVYEFKRSKNLLKLKYMNHIDLPVVDVYEGEPGSKYEGMLGGVLCEYRGNLVGVGSGWKDEERTIFWNNPNLIVGKTIEVKYQTESQNKDGEYSLRFPIKVLIREDK